MAKIVGPSSMIAQISAQIQNTILDDPTLDLRGKFDFTLLTQTQWAQGSILSNANFTFDGVPVLTSVGDPSFDPNFLEPPEFSVYVSTHGGDASLYPSIPTAEDVLARDVESFQTLLNTDNMRAFYGMYEMGNLDEIQVRFHLSGVS